MDQEDTNQQTQPNEQVQQPQETSSIQGNENKNKTWMIIAIVLGVLLLAGVVVSAVNKSNKRAADQMEDSLDKTEQSIQDSLDEAQKNAEEAMEKAKEDMEDSMEKAEENMDDSDMETGSGDNENEEEAAPTEEPEVSPVEEE